MGVIIIMHQVKLKVKQEEKELVGQDRVMDAKSD